MVGKSVQHYQFLERLGAGGMGEIYRAQDTRLNRFVAIKVLTGSGSSDPDRRRRFIQEAQSASALNHPNIITIHDILTEGDSQFMVMEHVQGKTLADLIPKGGLRVPQVLKYAMQMTDALQTAHSAGIIHRDLKPGNVMVTEAGLVKVLDFGLAKLAEPDSISQDEATRTISNAPRTVEGTILGTVAYMSPEQARGERDTVDERSDVYALSVLFHELLTGHHYLEKCETLPAMLDGVQNTPAPWPDDPTMIKAQGMVPVEFLHYANRGMAKNPGERFQSVTDMIDSLGLVREGCFPIQCPVTFTKRCVTTVLRAMDRNPNVAFATLGGTVLGLVASLATLIVVAVR